MKLVSQIIFIFSFLLCLTSCAPRVQNRPAHRTLTVVKVAPNGHRVVHVKGKKYYKWNGKYHRKTKKGFVVVRL